VTAAAIAGTWAAPKFAIKTVVLLKIATAWSQASFIRLLVGAVNVTVNSAKMVLAVLAVFST
jgi:hypothetical protein